jgi:hypothetical protein
MKLSEQGRTQREFIMKIDKQQMLFIVKDLSFGGNFQQSCENLASATVGLL